MSSYKERLDAEEARGRENLRELQESNLRLQREAAMNLLVLRGFLDSLPVGPALQEILLDFWKKGVIMPFDQGEDPQHTSFYSASGSYETFKGNATKSGYKLVYEWGFPVGEYDRIYTKADLKAMGRKPKPESSYAPYSSGRTTRWGKAVLKSIKHESRNTHLAVYAELCMFEYANEYYVVVGEGESFSWSGTHRGSDTEYIHSRLGSEEVRRLRVDPHELDRDRVWSFIDGALLAFVKFRKEYRKFPADFDAEAEYEYNEIVRLAEMGRERWE